MKKILVILLAFALVVPTFAQVTVSGNSSLEFEFAGNRNDATDGETDLTKLRNNNEITVGNDMFNLWYRARINVADNKGVDGDVMTESFVPGAGDSHINLWVTPTDYVKIGLGTDLGIMVGSDSWLDDNYFMPIATTSRSEVGLFRRGGGRGLAGTKRFAVQVMPIDGLTLTAGLPYDQDWAGMQTAAVDGNTVNMNWAAKYSMADIFAIGFGYSGAMGADEGWNMQASLALPSVPVVSPEIVFQIQNYNGSDANTNVAIGEFDSIDLGLKLNMAFGNLSLTPQFDISIPTYDDETVTALTQTWIDENMTAPFAVGVPVSYKVNDTITAGIDLAYGVGYEKYADTSDFVNPWRISARPKVTLNTEVGALFAQAGVLIDQRNNIATGAEDIDVGYVAEVSWKYQWK